MRDIIFATITNMIIKLLDYIHYIHHFNMENNEQYSLIVVCLRQYYSSLFYGNDQCFLSEHTCISSLGLKQS